MESRRLLSELTALVLLAVLLSTSVHSADSLSLSTDSPAYDVDLSALAPPDEENPYVTLPIVITIAGSLQSPTAPISLQVDSGEGLYLQAYEVDPFQGDLPAQTTVRLRISRGSETGERVATIKASSGSTTISTDVSLNLHRRSMTVEMLEPEPSQKFEPGNYTIRGRVDPPIEGVMVNVDLFHKYPQLKTQEQIDGYRSGIRYNGVVVTRTDGTFVIEPETIAFERGFGTYSADEIEGGVWYIHFYSNGNMLFGEELEQYDHGNPQATAGRGVKTFETEYSGVPEPLGSDVPAANVRKFIIGGSASPGWLESVPLLRELSGPIRGFLPEALQPYAPIVAIAVLLIVLLIVGSIVAKALSSRK